MATNYDTLLEDPRSKAVLGFLVAKNLLFHNDFLPLPSAKFTIRDALWVSENVEPRVLEVLPAVILHFPSAISRSGRMPQRLLEVKKKIKAGEDKGPALNGIPYKAMQRWANAPLKDKRTKPERKKRRIKSFKLSLEATHLLRVLAAQRNVTQTQVVESLLFAEAKR